MGAARRRGPILALGLEPRPFGATKIAGTDFGRIRLGSLRVVCLIDESARRVTVAIVARRSESTYRRLREE